MNSFVNRSGNEFPLRYQATIQRLSAQLWRKYPSIVDPADRDSCIELTLQRVANHEDEHGEAQDLAGLIWRIFPEVAASLLRKSRYQLPLETVAHPVLNDLAINRTAAEEMNAQLYAAQLLKGLPHHIAEILYLRFVEGLSAAETAKTLGMSEANVRQICHRAVQQLRREQQPADD